MTTRTASRIGFLAGTVLALAMVAGCAGTPASTSAPATSPAMSPSPMETAMSPSPSDDMTSATAALALGTAQTDLGEILVDGNGMTLYMFTNDSPNMSACEGQCLVNWPPLLGEPTAGEGADDSKLGSFARSDGSMQASYNGWPLYYWKDDAAPGDTTGQGVGGVWYVLDRDGEPIR